MYYNVQVFFFFFGENRQPRLYSVNNVPVLRRVIYVYIPTYTNRSKKKRASSSNEIMRPKSSSNQKFGPNLPTMQFARKKIMRIIYAYTNYRKLEKKGSFLGRTKKSKCEIFRVPTTCIYRWKALNETN